MTEFCGKSRIRTTNAVALYVTWILTIPSSDNAFSEKIPCCGEAMAENYFLLFKTLPTGHHTITVEVIRVPLGPSQPVEHDLAKWDINIV
jgi:hypothetical protein